MVNSLPIWRNIRYYGAMTMTLTPKLATQLSLAEIASANIRALCGRAGWNISDLANALNQNRTAIGYRWNNRTDWRLEEIEQVAALFGTTPWDLLTPAFGDKWNPDKKQYAIRDSNPEPTD
ncbi:helix-turn-helix domain-containing protein [uncultured Mobiluncus sp.]|uniref:helix-turn-helix domain-containing protein n=1 Tax=uncultured Mobiluncus sp. TaxID=293425 RepID=UPI0035A692B9